MKKVQIMNRATRDIQEILFSEIQDIFIGYNIWITMKSGIEYKYLNEEYEVFMS